MRCRGQGQDFGRSSAVVFLTRIAVVLAVLATSLITARWLGPHGRGHYSVAVLVTTVVSFVPGIMTAAVTYFTAGGQFHRPRILATTVLISSALGLLALALAAALFIPFRHELFGGLPAGYLALALVAVPFTVVGTDLAGLLRGLERFGSFSAAVLAGAILPLLGVLIALVAFDQGTGGAIAAYSVGTSLAGLTALVLARRAVGPVAWSLDRDYARAAVAYGARAHPGSILGFLGYRIDVFLVNGYLSPAAVGFYSISVAVAERVLTVAEAASVVLFPRIAAERDWGVRARLTPMVSRTVLWMTVLIAGALFLISEPLVSLLYSGRFEPAVHPLQVLLLGMVATAPARILGADIAARGRPVLLSYVAAVGLAVNVALNVVLIPRFGISGAAWASTISYSAVAVLTTIVYLAVSGASLADVLVPRRSDLVLLGRATKSMLGRRRAKAVEVEVARQRASAS